MFMSDKVEIENSAFKLAQDNGLDTAIVPWAGTLENGNGVIVFDWYVKGTGFGQMTMWVVDGKLKIDTECMGPEFAKYLLSGIVDIAEIDYEKTK